MLMGVWHVYLARAGQRVAARLRVAVLGDAAGAIAEASADRRPCRELLSAPVANPPTLEWSARPGRAHGSEPTPCSPLADAELLRERHPHQFTHQSSSARPDRGREMACLADGASRTRTGDLLGAIQAL